MNRADADRAASLEASKASQAQAKRENAKMRHTPGPWVVRTIDQSLATVETQDGEYIICNAAQLRGDDWKTEHAERKANARLIAESPDLVFQLLSAANYIDALGGDSKSYRAAIARATGEPQ